MDNNKKNNIALPIIVASSLVIGIILGYFFFHGGDRLPRTIIASGVSPGNNKLNSALQLIDKYYVEPVSTDSLIEKLMPHLVSELDPHTVYIPATDLAKANESLDGEFEGVGIVFNMATDTVVVLNVVPHGPSYKAGVQNGDRILKINDSLVAGQKIYMDDIVKMLRGPRGTTVDLSLKRQGISSLVPVTVTRDKIPIKSVDAAFMLTSDIGFLKLSSFSRNTHREVLVALSELSSAGMKELVFDLRGNSGGYLDQAIQLANEFLPDGKLIVYTEDRHGDKMKEYSNGKGRYQTIPLAILIDELSASSSEILAGAMQDNDRGVIVGRRSFGKGLVQQQMPFRDGSAMRLTVAHYYTPTGRSIQKPYSADGYGYDEEVLYRFAHNEMFSADSIKFADSLRYTTPGGKVVYGGGGIMPDVFVPIDTTDMTRYYFEVTGRNIVYRFASEYTDAHRAQINAIQTVAQLNDLLDGERDLLGRLVAYAQRNGVAPNWPEIRKSEKILLSQIRAYIGRSTPLEDVGFYSNIYPVDHTLLRAMDALKEDE